MASDANDSIFIPSDANGDCRLTNKDIGPFLLALTNAAEYRLQYPFVIASRVLDMNGDGRFTNADIAGFVDSLTN
ncbi:MAG: hypothetical protein AB8B50_03790 [Pirellulaceae bacterium]